MDKGPTEGGEGFPSLHFGVPGRDLFGTGRVSSPYSAHEERVLPFSLQ